MNEWIKDPRIQRNIAPQKLILLSQLADQKNSKKSAEELIPFFLDATSKAKSMGMSFTNCETDIILSVLTDYLPLADQARINTVRKMSRLLSEKNG